MDILTLFPLHTVLFPGHTLPLHIFEPRYRLMIGRCLERSAPFGVVLIRAGVEVGAPAEPYLVGTRAAILEHQRFPDGRYGLLCVGRDRFRVHDLVPGEPYLVGRVDGLADAPVEVDAPRLARRLADVLESGARSAGAEPPALPDDPAALSFAAAVLLPLTLAERQALLEMGSVRDRLVWLLDAVERETRLRERVGPTEPAHPHRLGPVSPN